MVHIAEAAPGGAGASTVRSTLRAERAQLVRWRRLLRARLDLVVAALAPPDPLCRTTTPDTPTVARLLVPRPEELAAAVSPTATADPVELMRRLRELDSALAAYGEELDAELVTHGETLDALFTSAGTPDGR